VTKCKILVLGPTPDKVLNSLVYGSPFYAIVYTSYKLSKMVRFLWLKLLSIFGVVRFLLTCAKNI